VLQLIKRNPQANPREEAVRLHVRVFRDKANELLKTPRDELSPKADETTVVKLFEEVKVLVRDLSDRVTHQSDYGTQHLRKPRQLLNLLELASILQEASEYGPEVATLAMLIVAGRLREDHPWLYEIIMEAYRAITSGSVAEMERASEQLHRVRSNLTPHDIRWLIRTLKGESGVFQFLEELASLFDRLVKSALVSLPTGKATSEEPKEHGEK
jgi:hypothetical protein